MFHTPDNHCDQPCPPPTPPSTAPSVIWVNWSAFAQDPTTAAPAEAAAIVTTASSTSIGMSMDNGTLLSLQQRQWNSSLLQHFCRQNLRFSTRLALLQSLWCCLMINVLIRISFWKSRVSSKPWRLFVDFNYLNIEKWQTLFCVLANFTFEVSKMKMTFLTPGTNVGIFSID